MMGAITQLERTLTNDIKGVRGEVAQTRASLTKIEVVLAGDALNGDAPPGVMQRVKALESLGAAFEAQMNAREARVKALEVENARLQLLLDPLKRAADEAKATKRKIVVGVVCSVLATIVLVAGGMFWIGFQASVGG